MYFILAHYDYIKAFRGVFGRDAIFTHQQLLWFMFERSCYVAEGARAVITMRQHVVPYKQYYIYCSLTVNNDCRLQAENK
jgi:hypothetical protein